MSEINGRNHGFTLLELLVVITLLGILATAGMWSMEGARDQAQYDTTKYEMAGLRKALRQFRLDMGHFPGNLTMLNYCQSSDSGQTDSYDALCPLANQANNSWNPDTRRGWNGPYFSDIGDGFVTIGDNLSSIGTGSPALGNPIQTKAIADNFTRASAGDFFVWQTCTTAGGPACAAKAEWGRPYLLFDSTSDYARIVSMGPDGVYDSAGNAANDATKCTPQKDDIVVCLLK